MPKSFKYDWDDFKLFETMRDDGMTPRDVHEVAVRAGLGRPAQYRMLRYVFDLSLAEAKEVIVGEPLDVHQARLEPYIRAAMYLRDVWLASRQ